MVFVRVRDNPPLVDVFSPILTEVEPTEQLYVKLSELTNRMPELSGQVTNSRGASVRDYTVVVFPDPMFVCALLKDHDPPTLL